MKKPAQLSGPVLESMHRRQMLKSAGGVAAVGGAFAARAPTTKADDGDPNDPTGLWSEVVTAADNSFPPFNTFQPLGRRNGYRQRKPGSNAGWPVQRRNGNLEKNQHRHVPVDFASLGVYTERCPRRIPGYRTNLHTESGWEEASRSEVERLLVVGRAPVMIQRL